MNTPLIVGIGGTTSDRSSTESALKIALKSAASHGARVKVFGGRHLQQMPHFEPSVSDNNFAREFLDAVREADGIIIGTPCYHGSISGLLKNALDHLERTSKDERVYLDGLPVGLIATAFGWQAVGTTLLTLRSIVHSLRGWPTPYGAGIKVTPGLFAEDACLDPDVQAQLNLVGSQVTDAAFRNINRMTLRAAT
ncbi:NAD(P)H-dependent oxidoreductase [Paraburkholderia sp. JHI869]|uniref:NADPH-dependent FMN reductase n=1 Tax=Paraburkholderia sp. JHI869 TaxID=3112959 RepID=UPI0031801E62